jgi:KaiC/GvpD/RAD55 family RecA-like ATPase
MALHVEVPGLDTIIPEIGEGKIVIVESGADGVKSFFVRRLARTALQSGLPVTFITSRDGAELSKELGNVFDPSVRGTGALRVIERDSLDGWNGIEALRGLLVIDSFSFLTLGITSTHLSEMLRRLRLVAHAEKLTIALATDLGMSDARSEAILGHLADGWIQFHAKEGADGLIRFLRVPKWMEGTLVDRNIYYEYDGKRLAIDLRRRVL